MKCVDNFTALLLCYKPYKTNVFFKIYMLIIESIDLANDSVFGFSQPIITLANMKL